MEQLYAPSIGSPIETPTPPRRSRLAGLALRPEPRPKARRPPTRFHARGDEPRRTEFDLQGQHLVRTLPGPTALLSGPVVRIAARVSEAARLGRGRALPGRHARLGPAASLARMERVTFDAVPSECPSCGVSLVVFPSSLLPQVSEKTGSVEAERDFAASLAEYRDGTERRYVVADVGGAFICPACATQATLISGR